MCDFFLLLLLCVSISVCGPDLATDPGCWKAKVSVSLQLTPLRCRLRVCACVWPIYKHIFVHWCLCVYVCFLGVTRSFVRSCFWTCVHACQCTIESGVGRGESWKTWVCVSVDVLQTHPALPWQLSVANNRLCLNLNWGQLGDPSLSLSVPHTE